MPLFIASKNMRGAWAPAPEDAVKVDVTSAQSKKSLKRIAFSPMHVGEGISYSAPDGEYACFEHYWQSLKVYLDVDHARGKTWWQSQMKAKRRYPNSKGKQVLHALDTRFPGVELGYVESRKKVYVPDYTAKLRTEEGKEGIDHIRQSLERGNVVIYDFDGPRNEDGTPACLEVTPDLLREKINDASFPFGHGYVVGGEALGIDPSQYV